MRLVHMQPPAPQADEFVGLIPLIRVYLQSINVDVETNCAILRYLDLIARRASGELLTPAAWMRAFIAAHPSYKKDSVVPPDVAHDLLTRIAHITDGSVKEPTLTGACIKV